MEDLRKLKWKYRKERRKGKSIEEIFREGFLKRKEHKQNEIMLESMVIPLGKFQED